MALQWIEKEFSTLELGDKRLDNRAKRIAEELSSMAESNPDRCQSEAALEATYRFVNNRKTNSEALLAPHVASTIKRAGECQTVILAQDTTEIDLTKPKCQVEGAGPLDNNNRFGYFLHPLYAMSATGVPLGIVDHLIWVRDRRCDSLSAQERDVLRKNTSYEEKESCRWLEMFQSGEQIARANPQTHFIHVADSESDIFELFLEIEEQAKNHDFVLRAGQNRLLEGADDSPRTLDELLSNCPVLGEREVRVSERISLINNDPRPRRKSRSARVAKVSIRATTANLRGADRPGGRLPSVTLNVIESIELDPPDGEDPIRWVLLTSLPIETLEQIEQAVNSYAKRWEIELYFKTLKSGMRIEKLGYETIERYLTAAALMMVVAWRIEYIKNAARQDDSASCEKYFEPEEWKPAYMVSKKTRKLPKQPPTIGEFTILLARLGGYLAKKNQGPPGSMTLWRGLRKLADYRDIYFAVKDQIKDV